MPPSAGLSLLFIVWCPAVVVIGNRLKFHTHLLYHAGHIKQNGFPCLAFSSSEDNVPQQCKYKSFPFLSLQEQEKTWKTPWQLSSSKFKPLSQWQSPFFEFCIYVWNITGACTCDCGQNVSSELGSDRFVTTVSFSSLSTLDFSCQSIRLYTAKVWSELFKIVLCLYVLCLIKSLLVSICLMSVSSSVRLIISEYSQVQF